MASPRAETGYALCVEDDPMVARAAIAFLERCGFDSVRHAATLREATRTVDEERPIFALLDLDLGSGLTSVPLVERLRDVDVPMAIMSGYSGDDLPKEVDGIAFLPKPLTFAALKREVERQLKKKAG